MTIMFSPSEGNAEATEQALRDAEFLDDLRGCEHGIHRFIDIARDDERFDAEGANEFQSAR